MSGRELARMLVEEGAVELRTDPDSWFTWSSGERAPIYCDNRTLISSPRARTRVTDALLAALEQHFGGAEVVAGTATAGIPWAAWVSDRLGLPMVYVRSAPKEHGQGRRVEGRALDGERVVVIEDLISFGGSALGATEGIARAGGKVAGVQAIVSYGFPQTSERFRKAGVEVNALVGFDDPVAFIDPDPEAARVLRAWRDR